MWYSYSYDCLRGADNRLKKTESRRRRVVEDDEEGDGGAALEVDTGIDQLLMITPESIAAIPEDEYVMGTAEGDVTLVCYDAFVDALRNEFGDDALIAAEMDDPGLQGMFDGMCDDKFGPGDWDRFDDYGQCDGCSKWVYLEAMYESDDDFWVPPDGGLLCGDCVRNCPDEYIEFLKDNPDAENRLLSDDGLSEQGWEIVDTFSTFGENYPKNCAERERLLSELRRRYPGADFIFDASCAYTWRREYRVWGNNIPEDEYADEEEEDEE